MTNMNVLFRNWHMVRIIQLIGGIAMGIYALNSRDYIFLILAIILLIQAIFNISCCGSGACSNNSNQKQVYKDEIIKYKPSNDKH